MSEADVRVPADALRAFVCELFEKLGVQPAHARLMAETLVAANLRGVDSHGLQLIPFYTAQIEDGRVNPKAEGHLVSQNGAVAVYDGENGLGQVVSDKCWRLAVEAAREHGLGLALARESNHFGAAAWWALQISRQGMIGIVLCNASSMVAPWQGKDPRWGTNPICVSLPGEGEGRWLLDMATTTVALGKIYRANIQGQAEIPPGWALDRDGVPTTSTQAALSGLLAPLGGYKGSGLAMMVEILCAVLSGGAMSTELGGLRVKGRPFRVSQFFLAIDVSRVMPREEFALRVEKLVAMVKSSAPAAGYDEVLVAGEPEWRAEAERRRTGVPVSGAMWARLQEIAARYGVAMPPAAPALS